MTASGQSQWPPEHPSWQPADWRESGQHCGGPSKMPPPPTPAKQKPLGRCVREKHLTWGSNMSEMTFTVPFCRKGKFMLLR